MTFPKTDIVQMSVQNQHASAPLIIPVAVVRNTSDADLERNVRINAARDLEWVKAEEPHDGVAVIVGGGPSVVSYLPSINAMDGAIKHRIFALNATSQWLRALGIRVDYQIIADAKPETVALVDDSVPPPTYLFASQCSPACFEQTVGHGHTLQRDNIILWHLEIGNYPHGIERWFPEERVRRGGYALLGGGAAVGNAAVCLVYALGYREMHLFGFDSSHSPAGNSHAYNQPMNDLIPNVETEWAGKKYVSSIAMKAQAEKFQITGRLLEQHGCRLHVYGDGLLQAMWNTRPEDMTERDKYRTLWRTELYRENSPGEALVSWAIGMFRDRGLLPGDLIVDYGCGTGRAGLRMQEAGYEPFLVDFADNARDEEALALPFLEWDLALPCPVSSKWGFCCDMLEHIPERQLGPVVRNIMASAEVVFFQVATRPDDFGALVGMKLHLMVRPAAWWISYMGGMGYTVLWDEAQDGAVQMLVRR